MNIERPWLYFALVATAISLIRLPVFRFLDSGAGGVTRYAPLDGLRGVLAFSVFVFHLIVTYRFTATGLWEPPSSNFYALLGPLAVSLFFMITGFLFWEKLLRAKGRPSWRALYIGRLFRIAPMYLFAVFVMLAIVLARTGGELRDSASTVLASVLQWLALGLLNTQPDVNGYPATHLLAGVTWTIAYEWAFYASLMITACFARGRTHLPIVVVALAFCLAAKVLLASSAMGFAALFLSGMTVASLLHEGIRPRVTDNTASATGLICIATIFAAPLVGDDLSGFGTIAGMLLAVFFYLVCTGASLFGLLTATATRRFGDVSYSLYLLQGLVLTLVFGIAPVRDFAMLEPAAYWAVGALCACVLTVAACLTYRFIEQPGIALGRRLVSQQRRKAVGPLPGTSATPALPSRAPPIGLGAEPLL